jgi:hypothetical protein
MKIAHKLGLLVGMLLAALFVSILVLALSLRSVSTGYDDLLDNQVHQAAQARVMQVEFKKQVQEFDRLLLQGDDPAIMKTTSAATKAYDDRVKQINRELLAQAHDSGVRASLAQFQAGHAALDSTYAAAQDAFVRSGSTNGLAVTGSISGQDVWPSDLIDIVVADYERNTARAVAAQQDAAGNLLRAIVVLSALLLALAAGAAIWVVRGIVRPVRALTDAALSAANDRLPRVVAEIGNLPADAPAPDLPAFRVTSRDELSDLATALTTLQSSAVDLALDQRQNELANAETLVNLGRRNQSLLTRTLSYVTELEREERDPELLGKLFRLDHLATRIRRNAESMLVLAGAEQTRTWTKPVAMEDVLRAALSEIEDYTRVTVQGVDAARVHGGVAADLAHMIAELLENATRFSPESHQVHILGRAVPFGYQLDIMDEGLGMSAEELAVANRRIELAGQERPDTKVLGHHVVGRLARRRGIRVRLVPSPTTGVVAQLLVPQALLSAPLAAEPVEDASVAELEAAEATVAESPAGAPPAESQPAESQPVARPDVTVLTEIPRPGAPAPAPAPVETYPAAAPVAQQVAQPVPAYPVAAPVAEAAPAADVPGGLPAQRASALGAFFGGERGAAAAGDDGSGGLPGRRVRGAQLPDLGDSEEIPVPQRDPSSIGRQLSGLQASTARARHEASAAGQTGNNDTQGS